MATAVVEERQLLKSLRWWDGFVIALCNPGFLIAALGFEMGALGTWGAMLLWGCSAAIGMMQAWIYSETAAMFPDKPGGISLYAHEGWRGRFSLFGPLGAFGYWIGWSVVLAIFGDLIGTLIQAQWFPNSTWTWFSVGSHAFGLPALIGVVAIVLVWTLNIFGLRPAVWISYITGAGLMVPLVLFILVPYLTGHWHSSNMTWSIAGFSGFRLAIVFMFLNGWSAYGVEVCATFAPEYKDTKRETAIALRSAAMFSLFVFIFFPLGIGGEFGAPSTATASGAFYHTAMVQIVGGAGAGIITALLIGSLFLSMISSTADGSRALYGIARDDMTIKQLYHLNKHHVPGRAMTVDMVVNIALIVVFGGSNLAILYMSNIGYILAHILALTGFLLLRRDRPNWPRPIKVGAPWLAIAGFLAVLNFVFLGFGIASPSLTGYGDATDLWVGLGVLVGSLLLFFFRRMVQDRKPVTFRDEVPTMPTPEQMILLGQVAAAPPVASPV
jgi:amino acid transporter